MDLSKLSIVFKVVIIGVIYCIIFYALKIMYKDMKNGNKKRTVRKNYGLEIVSSGTNSNLKRGSVIPIGNEIRIGRKEDNQLPLDDSYVSNYHAKIFIKNNQIFIEDLGSTNGTILNGKRINGKVPLKSGDDIAIGKTAFKVIG